MSFWTSDLGQLTGNANDAFAKQIKMIPDNTTALAKILKFTLEDNNGKQYYQIEWELITGDFTRQRVYQKIHAFDSEPKKSHRAKNMLMYIFKMFGVSPSSSAAPSNADLLVFTNKVAGLRIQETEPNENGKQYNWVSEVHPQEGFKTETGIKIEVTHTPYAGVESALTRNPRGTAPNINDDIPF